MGNKSRNKGHNFERQIVNELKELGFDKVASSRSQNRNADNCGVDIVGFPGYYIQCKSMKNFSSKQAIKELKKISKNKKKKDFLDESYIPLVFIKITFEGEIVTMNKSDFYKLLIDK